MSLFNCTGPGKMPLRVLILTLMSRHGIYIYGLVQQKFPLSEFLTITDLPKNLLKYLISSKFENFNNLLKMSNIETRFLARLLQMLNKLYPILFQLKTSNIYVNIICTMKIGCIGQVFLIFIPLMVNPRVSIGAWLGFWRFGLKEYQKYQNVLK